MREREYECSEDELLGRLVDLECAKDELLYSRQTSGAVIETIKAIDCEQDLIRRLYHKGLL